VVEHLSWRRESLGSIPNTGQKKRKLFLRYSFCFTFSFIHLIYKIYLRDIRTLEDNNKIFNKFFLSHEFDILRLEINLIKQKIHNILGSGKCLEKKFLYKSTEKYIWSLSFMWGRLVKVMRFSLTMWYWCGEQKRWEKGP
jgi:hypothetical protein